MFFSSGALTALAAGAVLNLDRQVFGHFMVGRPLVVGFVIGLMNGEPGYGAWMGLSAELLWLAVIPLGGQLTPNSGLAVAAALAAWLGSGFGPAVGAYQTEAGLVISFLTLPFWAWAFSYIDALSRRLVEPQLARAAEDLDRGRDPAFFRRNLRGLWTTLGLSLAAVSGAALVNSLMLAAAARLMPEFALVKLGFLFAFIPFLGLVGMAVFLQAKTFNLYLYGLLAGLLALSAVA